MILSLALREAGAPTKKTEKPPLVPRCGGFSIARGATASQPHPLHEIAQPAGQERYH